MRLFTDYALTAARRILTILALVHFCCGSAGARQHTALDELGLSLIVPEGWFRVSADSELSRSHPDAAIFASPRIEEQSVLFVSRTPASGRPLDYAVLSAIHYVYTKMYGHIYKEDEIEIDGEDGYYILYQGGYAEEAKAPKRYFRCMTLHDGYLYVFHALAAEKSFKEHEGNFLSVVKSVRWKANSLEFE